MTTISWIALRALLERRGSSKKTALVRYLSHSGQEAIEAALVPDRDPFSYDLSIPDRIKAVHYSWMIPFLERLPEKDRVWVLSSLGSLQAAKLQLHFGMKHGLKRLNFHPKQFLQRFIYHWLISTQKGFIPREYLPTHPLNIILELSKSGIQHLVDFLGLHDLSIELKKVVKTEQFQKVKLGLSKQQCGYLKQLCEKREPVPFARLNLDGWDGNQTKLKNMLHHRGFNRLGKALFGCHPALMWHITRRLDIGRTKILRKFFTDINNEKAHESLKTQVINLVPFIRKHYE